jgi:hypothetical protein
MKFRKKPVVVEAERLTKENFPKVMIFTKDLGTKRTVLNIEHPTLGIETLEGVMRASEGDYIIKGVNGEFYPCKPDIFEATYEKVEA